MNANIDNAVILRDHLEGDESLISRWINFPNHFTLYWCWSLISTINVNYCFCHLVWSHIVNIFVLAMLSRECSNVFLYRWCSNIIILCYRIAKILTWDEFQLSGCSFCTGSLGPVLLLYSSQSKSGCWHMHCRTELVTDPSLPSFSLSNQHDRIRAFEITAGCKLAWKCLCSHLMFPPTLGKIFIWIWSINYHTAGLDYVFILSSFFSWNKFIDMFTRIFFSHVFFSAVGYASFR